MSIYNAYYEGLQQVILLFFNSLSANPTKWSKVVADELFECV